MWFPCPPLIVCVEMWGHKVYTCPLYSGPEAWNMPSEPYNIRMKLIWVYNTTSLGKNNYENCLNVLIWGQSEYFWIAGSNLILRNMKKILKDFLGVTNPFIARPKTTMKIAKIYLFGAKKYTSEAKIILLQQYTFIWKFCCTTPGLQTVLKASKTEKS